MARPLPTPLAAVFIQPTWNCRKDCKGCYVKAAANSTSERRARRENLISAKDPIFPQLLLGNYHLVRPSQVTLAVDALPSQAIDAPSRERMLLFFELFLRYSHLSTYPSLHLTVNTTSDLEEYFTALGLPLTALSTCKTLVSVSFLGPFAARSLLHYLPPERLNWNVTAREFLTSYEEVLPLVGHANILFSKAPLGRSQSTQSLLEFLEAEEIVRRLSPPLADKVSLDPCILESREHVSIGLSCSANIDKLHIWPDGAITGCPYSTSPPRTLNIDENILLALEEYDFDRCRIHHILPPKTKKGRAFRALNYHLPMVQS